MPDRRVRRSRARARSRSRWPTSRTRRRLFLEDIPAGVSDLVMSLLEKRPTDRPVDAEAVGAQAALLREANMTGPVPPLPTSPTTTAVAGAATAVSEHPRSRPPSWRREPEPEPEKRSRRGLFLILGCGRRRDVADRRLLGLRPRRR